MLASYTDQTVASSDQMDALGSIVVEQPDGTMVLGVDEEKARQHARTIAPAVSRDEQNALAAEQRAAAEAAREANEFRTSTFGTSQKVFLMLLAYDFGYFIFILCWDILRRPVHHRLHTNQGSRPDVPGHSRSRKAHVYWWLNTAELRIEDVLLAATVDLIGLAGSFSSKVSILTLFLILKSLSIALLTFEAGISLFFCANLALLATGCLLRYHLHRLHILEQLALASPTFQPGTRTPRLILITLDFLRFLAGRFPDPTPIPPTQQRAHNPQPRPHPHQNPNLLSFPGSLPPSSRQPQQTLQMSTFSTPPLPAGTPHTQHIAGAAGGSYPVTIHFPHPNLGHPSIEHRGIRVTIVPSHATPPCPFVTATPPPALSSTHTQPNAGDTPNTHHPTQQPPVDDSHPPTPTPASAPPHPSSHDAQAAAALEVSAQGRAAAYTIRMEPGLDPDLRNPGLTRTLQELAMVAMQLQQARAQRMARQQGGSDQQAPVDGQQPSGGHLHESNLMQQQVGGDQQESNHVRQQGGNGVVTVAAQQCACEQGRQTQQQGGNEVVAPAPQRCACEQGRQAQEQPRGGEQPGGSQQLEECQPPRESEQPGESEQPRESEPPAEQKQ